MRLFSSYSILAVVGLCLLSPLASAQVIGGAWERDHYYNVPGYAIGTKVANVGDLNSDGIPDYAMNSAGDRGASTSPGAVLLFSGATHGVLGGISAPAPDSDFGKAISSCGDVNGDGVPDILIGEQKGDPGGLSWAGSAYLYSGADFSLLHQWNGQNASDFFGNSVSGVGDQDGDGVPDILIAAYGFSTGGNMDCGVVHCYSGATRTLLNSYYGTTDFQYLGVQVNPIGDLNGDGIEEALLGCLTARVEVITPGSATSVHVITHPTGTFGNQTSAISDLDGDGVDDILVSDHNSSGSGIPPQAGRVHVYSGASAAPITILDGTEHAAHFGGSLSRAGDVDGDGIEDIVVGAPDAQPHTSAGDGSCFIFSGDGFHLIGRIDGGQHPLGFRFGTDVAPAGDTDGDGRDEILVASANNHGVRQYSKLPCLAMSATEMSAAIGGSVDLEIDFPAELAGLDYKVVLSTTGTGPTLYGIEIPLTQDAMATGTFSGNYPFPIHNDLQGTLDSAGDAQASITIPAGMLSNVIGMTGYFAVIALPTGRGPVASSIAQELTVIP